MNENKIPTKKKEQMDKIFNCDENNRWAHRAASFQHEHRLSFSGGQQIADFCKRIPDKQRIEVANG